MILMAVLLILAGAVMVVWPSAVWAFSESWKSSDATEPSDLYLVSTRIGGVITGSVGTVFLVVLLVL